MSLVTPGATCTFGQEIFTAGLREDWGAQGVDFTKAKVEGWLQADSLWGGIRRQTHVWAKAIRRGKVLEWLWTSTLSKKWKN